MYPAIQRISPTEKDCIHLFLTYDPTVCWIVVNNVVTNKFPISETQLYQAFETSMCLPPPRPFRTQGFRRKTETLFFGLFRGTEMAERGARIILMGCRLWRCLFRSALLSVATVIESRAKRHFIGAMSRSRNQEGKHAGVNPRRGVAGGCSGTGGFRVSDSRFHALRAALGSDRPSGTPQSA